MLHLSVYFYFYRLEIEYNTRTSRQRPLILTKWICTTDVARGCHQGGARSGLAGWLPWRQTSRRGASRLSAWLARWLPRRLTWWLTCGLSSWERGTSSGTCSGTCSLCVQWPKLNDEHNQDHENQMQLHCSHGLSRAVVFLNRRSYTTDRVWNASMECGKLVCATIPFCFHFDIILRSRRMIRYVP